MKNETYGKRILSEKGMKNYEHNITYHGSRDRQSFWNRNQTVGAGGCFKSYHHGLFNS
mgnify:CR=1 FL=1